MYDVEVSGVTEDAQRGGGAAFGRLLVLVSSVFLLTSRVMLLLHEFVGHGAVAMLLGGEVTGWHLFLFAGGRVSSRTEGIGLDGRILVSLGGIALELVLGAIAIALARRLRARTVVAFCLWCAGSVVVAHAALYLARGVHYGFGDGALLAQRLDTLRWAIVFPASALAVATALVSARHLAVSPASIFAGSRRAVAGTTLVVFVCAGLVHGALAWAEVRYFPDSTWGAIMENASARNARAELADRIAHARRLGESIPSLEEQHRMLEALERARRPWPLDPVLFTALAAAIVVGLIRGVREGQSIARARPPSWRAIGVAAALLVAALGVIVVLRYRAGRAVGSHPAEAPAPASRFEVARSLGARRRTIAGDDHRGGAGDRRGIRGDRRRWRGRDRAGAGAHDAYTRSHRAVRGRAAGTPNRRRARVASPS